MKPSIYLIGETSFHDPVTQAEKMLQEVNLIFSKTHWNKEKRVSDILVESLPVKGDLQDSNILLMRSSGILQRSAKSVFDLLVSPEGYAILDPISNVDDHKKPLVESYDWKADARIEVATARVNIPIMPKTEFLVLNVIDNGHFIFASKSIVHPKYPGSSIYYTGNESYSENPPNGSVRAINTMGIQVIPKGENTCQLLVFNYVDMCLKKGQTPWLYNTINRHFFPALYKRIEKHMKSGICAD